jgi:PadR family transcriptional regulator AphA
MNVKTLCLAILYFGESTGYEIRKLSVEGVYAYFVEASYGAIYPALARLESEGLVTCREQSQSGKPARKVYSITDAGRTAFIEALMEHPRADEFRSEFLLVAKCAQLLPPQIIARAIKDRVAYLKAELAQFQECHDDCDNPAARWTIKYGHTVHQASLDYLVQHGPRLIEIAGRDAVGQNKPELLVESES